uniref:Uncharacterized protein n=1 Tax=Knipowitschia caucasica TaxID=637954 RepID=A0AAV2LE10_KNICA
MWCDRIPLLIPLLFLLLFPHGTSSHAPGLSQPAPDPPQRPSPPITATPAPVIQEEGLTKEIRDEISSLRETTKADIKTVHDKLMGKVESLFSMQKEAAVTQSDMEQSLSDTSDRLTALENSYQTLAADQKKLEEKCIDLENRSRRQNIRILNIPERAENNMPTIFIATFLSKVLGEENFDGPILVDCAHRSLAPKPRSGERPRPMIARLHYYSDK